MLLKDGEYQRERSSWLEKDDYHLVILYRTTKDAVFSLNRLLIDNCI